MECKSPKYININRSISMIYRQRNCFFAKKFEKFNIGSGQYMFLLHLYINENMNQEELSNKLKVDKATTARAIKKLEEEEYLTRSTSNDDKRAYKIVLTNKAMEIKDEFFEIITQWEDYVVRDLTQEEKETLITLLNKITFTD
jgi:DNA-binding MarR family transcriptional regulator